MSWFIIILTFGALLAVFAALTVVFAFSMFDDGASHAGPRPSAVRAESTPAGPPIDADYPRLPL